MKRLSTLADGIGMGVLAGPAGTVAMTVSGARLPANPGPVSALLTTVQAIGVMTTLPTAAASRHIKS